MAALAAGQNIPELVSQILEFQPDFVSVKDQEARKRLVEALAFELPPGRPMPDIGQGREGAVEVARWEGADTVIAAITGFAGLEPVLAAAAAGRKIALANKESLVVAGEEVRRQAELSGAFVLPVDSEHSALWQCMLAAPPDSIRRLILTCSGGPFYGKGPQDLALVRPDQALNHPTWSMGAKITIDSASLMNKAFEVIEACHLFGVPHRMVDVIIHPQSLVHSLLEFNDGAILAQLGDPDMTLPIRLALTFPRRSDKGRGAPFDFLASERSTWTFGGVDDRLFPSILMARQAMEAGGLMPLVLNAANEAAVARFLSGDLSFTGIHDLVRRSLDHFSPLAAIKAPSFDDMMNQHLRVMDYAHKAAIS